MADTEDAPTRATAHRATTSANGNHVRRTPKTPEDLESQLEQLQDEIRSITDTLGRMGKTTVKEARSTAQRGAQDLADRGQSMLSSAQDEFNSIEKQLKDTIRDKPLTAVMGAIAVGFVIAVLTR
jgi:ElaB/YqjD/DUF883 family membrane-anchored ribosome-binding protein